MEISDLKYLFKTFSFREPGSKGKKLFGMEYENFIFVPNEEKKELQFLPLSLNGDPGIFSVLEKLIKLTENTDDPLEKVFENDMLLSLFQLKE